MTDMPFVAPLTTAMGFLMLGLHTPQEERVRTYAVKLGARRLLVSAWHLLFLGILLCAIPQILYLLSRNLELHLFGAGKHGFLAHFDRFEFGSAGNCGLPGNKACHLAAPAAMAKPARNAILRFVLGGEPAVQAFVWTTLTGALVAWNLGERRRQRPLLPGGVAVRRHRHHGQGPPLAWHCLHSAHFSIWSRPGASASCCASKF